MSNGRLAGDAQTRQPLYLGADESLVQNLYREQFNFVTGANCGARAMSQSHP